MDQPDDDEPEIFEIEPASTVARPSGMQPRKRMRGLALRLRMVSRGTKKPAPSGRTTRPTPSMPKMPWDGKDPIE